MQNYSANDTRRIDLVMGVGYEDDLGVAVRTCMDVISADPRVLEDPEPVVAVHELGDSSVNLVVRPWVKSTDYWATRWDLTRALKENLEAAGCSIPFPQRDVHLYQTS
jgi:small conductance mechanosensitive channel